MNTCDKKWMKPIDVDLLEAGEAITTGDTAALSAALVEAGKNIESIGLFIQSFASTQIEDPVLQTDDSSWVEVEGVMVEMPEVEWSGTTNQINTAIQSKDVNAVSVYLQHLSIVIRRVGCLLDDDVGSREKYVGSLKKRRTRGRPRKEGAEALLEASRLRLRVKLGRQTEGKQENVIQDIVAEGGPSRATIHRTLARGRNKPIK